MTNELQLQSNLKINKGKELWQIEALNCADKIRENIYKLEKEQEEIWNHIEDIKQSHLLKEKIKNYYGDFC
jgi:hypothetical protein